MIQPIISRSLVVFSRYNRQISIKKSHRMLSTSLQKLDHYKTLGVSNKATAPEIKENYLKKCKEFHPDKHQGNPYMHDKFVKINDAYTILSDPKTKSEYDMRFHTSANRNKSQHAWGNNHTSSDPENVWQQAYKRAEERAYRSHDNPYRSHDNPYRSHDNPYEHWQNSRSYQERASYYRNRNPTSRRRHKDPLNDYWDRVYNANRSSQANNSSSPYESNMDNNPDYSKIIAAFLGALIVVLWVRYWFAMRTLSKNSHWYQKPYYERESNLKKPPTPEDKYGNSGGTNDLNFKTEDA